MSYQERRAIVSIIATLAINAVYWPAMLQRYPAGDAYAPEVFHFWGAAFLILIAVTIVVKIATYIFFSIANAIATREEEPSFSDERDKLVELKGTRNGMYAMMIGIPLAMVALVVEQPPSVMFVVFIAAGLASDVISDVSHFIYYRRGV